MSLCLPETGLCDAPAARCSPKIGPDDAPLREQDRGAILFDLGLDVLQTDLCVRVADPRRCGRAASLCRIGRRSIPQIRRCGSSLRRTRIGSSSAGHRPRRGLPANSSRPAARARTVRTPMCCRSCCSTSARMPATEPVPAGFVPCAHLYPKHPVEGRVRAREVCSTRDRHRVVPGSAPPVRCTGRGRDQGAGCARWSTRAGTSRHARSPTIATRAPAFASRLRQLKAAGHASSALTAVACGV